MNEQEGDDIMNDLLSRVLDSDKTQTIKDEGVDLGTPIQELYHKIVEGDDFLKHYGIMGMKWGVRRYQNPDGTLTAEGRRRKGKSKTSLKSTSSKKESTGKKEPSDKKKNKDAEKKHNLDSKNRKILSDKELTDKITRLENEKKLKNLVGEEVNPGKTWVKKVMSNSGTRAANTIVSGAMIYFVKVALEKKFDAKTAAQYMAPKPGKK